MLRHRFISFRRFILCILPLGVAGCSQNTTYVTDTFKDAFLGPGSQTITADYIRSLPYASTYIKMGANPAALLILTKVTNTHNGLEEKWLSADKELIVTQNGRIIKTVNIKQGNLVSIRSSLPDPLSLGIQRDSTPKQWFYQISWQPGYHWNYQAVSTFTVGHLEDKQLITGKQTLLHVTENVSIPSINQHYQNHYWVNPQTGKPVVSEQYLYPGSGQTLLTVTKPYYGDAQ